MNIFQYLCWIILIIFFLSEEVISSFSASPAQLDVSNKQEDE